MHKRKTKSFNKDVKLSSESVLRLNLIFNVIGKTRWKKLIVRFFPLSAQDYIESIYQVIQFWLNKSPDVTKIIWSRQR